MVVHQVAGSIPVWRKICQPVFFPGFQATAVFHFNVGTVGRKKHPGKLPGLFRREWNIQHGQFVQQLPGMETGQSKLKQHIFCCWPGKGIDALFILLHLKLILCQMKKEKPGQMHPQ